MGGGKSKTLEHFAHSNWMHKRRPSDVYATAAFSINSKTPTTILPALNRSKTCKQLARQLVHALKAFGHSLFLAQFWLNVAGPQPKNDTLVPVVSVSCLS